MRCGYNAIDRRIDIRVFEVYPGAFQFGHRLLKHCSRLLQCRGNHTLLRFDLFDGGSENYVPFDAGVWAEAVADHAEWAALVAAHVTQLITEHMAKREATRGNLQPSSM